MNVALAVTDAPTPEQAKVIGSGLAGFNAEKAGYSDSRDLAVVISDPETKRALGGLLGRTSLGLLFIDLLFVPESLPFRASTSVTAITPLDGSTAIPRGPAGST